MTVPAFLPQVTIVGRPNVGKSTLFNRLTGRRKALVHDQPGVTRDRVIAEVDMEGRRIRLVDTGGFDTSEDDVIRRGIREQVERALRESDAIVFVVDSRSEVSGQDLEIADVLRRSGPPVVLVGSKADNPDPDAQARHLADLHTLGFGDVIAVSAEHKVGIDELEERLVELLPPTEELVPPEPGRKVIRVAVVGRPNVGKSSILNAILGDERCLVTSEAGTTRDAVDVRHEGPDGTTYEFIDTAGIRRKGKVEEAPEKLSVVMARKSIARCDVAVVVVDGSERIAHQDAVVAGYAYEAGRAVVLVINKWDLLRGDVERRRTVQDELRARMKFLDFTPVVRTSAKTHKGLERLLPRVRMVYESAGSRVPTTALNRFSEEVIRPSGATVGTDVKIYYLTQSGVHPPTFTLFTNAKGSKVHFSYVRFLENRLRQAFGFEGTPIRFRFETKKPRRGGRKRRGRVVRP